MSRERDEGREPRKEPVDRLTPDRARDGKAEEPLRFGPEREPQGAPPKGGRPDWKKASARKVRESAAIEQERREGMSPSRGDGQPLPEQAAPVFQDDPFRPAPDPTPEPEPEEPAADLQEVEGPRGPDRPDPHGGPASRLRFDKESDTVKPEPDKASAPQGSRPAGRGPSPSQEAGAGMGQSVPKDSPQHGTEGKFRKESNQDKVNRAKFRMEQREGKLDQANRKLAKQKPVKPKGPVRSVLGTAGWGVHGYVHGKIYENEHENVGIEGGHRSELAAETAGRKGVRFVKRKVRQHPAKAAQRAQSKFTKATAEYQFRMAAQEHPELRRNIWKRLLYKRRLKKQARQRTKDAAK